MTTELLGLPNRPLTRADLALMPDDGHRYELIDGVLIVSPAPRRAHQRALVNLLGLLVDACPDDCEVLPAPFAVVLADDTEIQPDLLLARDEQYTEKELPGAPLLAVEILSPSSRRIDLLLKKDRLLQAGCEHYWAVDPGEPSVVAWRLIEGEYAEVARATGDQPFRATAPLEVTFQPSDLQRRR